MPVDLKIDYVKSVHGILKIFEIITLLIGFACAASFNNGYQINSIYYGSVASSRVGYFIAVSVLVWLICIAMFVLCLLGFFEKVQYPRKKLIVGIFHGGLALFLLIGAAVAAAHAGALPCYHYDIYTTTSCGTLNAAVVFGFFAVIALVVDAVLFVMVGFKETVEAAGGGGSPDTPKKDIDEPE